WFLESQDEETLEVKMKSSLCLSLLALLSALPARAVSPSVCDRTPQIRDFLVEKLDKPCAEINDADLLQIGAIRVPRTGLQAIKSGDFAGLSRLETLNLKRNAISELPAGILAPLTSLRVLVLLGNNIRQLPDDFTVGNTRLEKIHIFA